MIVRARWDGVAVGREHSTIGIGRSIGSRPSAPSIVGRHPAPPQPVDQNLSIEVLHTAIPLDFARSAAQFVTLGRDSSIGGKPVDARSKRVVNVPPEDNASW
jgi:hypothetical protein